MIKFPQTLGPKPIDNKFKVSPATMLAVETFKPTAVWILALLVMIILLMLSPEQIFTEIIISEAFETMHTLANYV